MDNNIWMIVVMLATLPLCHYSNRQSEWHCPITISCFHSVRLPLYHMSVRLPDIPVTLLYLSFLVLVVLLWWVSWNVSCNHKQQENNLHLQYINTDLRVRELIRKCNLLQHWLWDIIAVCCSVACVFPDHYLTIVTRVAWLDTRHWDHWDHWPLWPSPAYYSV